MGMNAAGSAARGRTLAATKAERPFVRFVFFVVSD
jgi:hypothetical protein